jgi:hypothetical protein
MSAVHAFAEEEQVIKLGTLSFVRNYGAMKAPPTNNVHSDAAGRRHFGWLRGQLHSIAFDASAAELQERLVDMPGEFAANVSL